MWIIQQEPRWLTATCLPHKKRKSYFKNWREEKYPLECLLLENNLLSCLSCHLSIPLAMPWRKTEDQKKKKSKRHDWQFHFHTVLQTGQTIRRAAGRGQTFDPLMNPAVPTTYSGPWGRGHSAIREEESAFWVFKTFTWRKLVRFSRTTCARRSRPWGRSGEAAAESTEHTFERNADWWPSWSFSGWGKLKKRDAGSDVNGALEVASGTVGNRVISE